MYAAGADSQLRQGDICAIEHIPIWYFTKASVLKSPGDTADSIVIPTWDRAAKSEDGRSLVAVGSQCCDLENPAKGNRIGILVAPLMKVPASPAKESEKYTEIMSSREVDPGIGAYRWMQLFPFLLPGSDGQDAIPVVADMSALTTMAPAPRAVDVLQRSRLWTLEDSERDLFRIKLAAMVGRPPSPE